MVRSWLLPSGIVRKNKISVIGNGVVVDPWALLKEIASIKEKGVEVTPKNLILAENATLILPVHQTLDSAMEEALGAKSIGTTRRGIGPAYEDKVARRSIRVCDLENPELLKEKLERMMWRHNAFLKGIGVATVDGGNIYNELMKIREEVLSYSGVVWKILDEARAKGKKIAGWTLDEHGLVSVLPQSPVNSDAPVEPLVLVPIALLGLLGAQLFMDETAKADYLRPGLGVEFGK